MTTPTAIILADQPLHNELETIFGAQQTASLMIAGYPVIEHILMELQDLQFKHCFVLAHGNAHAIQASIGNTDRWGMDMRIEVMNYPMGKEQVLRQFKELAAPHGLLVIEADRLRTHAVANFLQAAAHSELNLLQAVADNTPLGITLLKPCDADFIINPAPIPLSGIVSNPLQGTRDFFQANFDVLAGKFAGLGPSVSMNLGLNRLQHWTSNVHRRSCIHDNVMIDKGCRVSSNASLRSVILNRDVFLEKNTVLNNTIVMPNSVISDKTPINNAIVHQNNVYQLVA